MGKKEKDKRKYTEVDAETKEQKKARKRAEKAAKLLGYSNEVNPFGDSNLMQPFVWGKKKEKDEKDGKVDDGDTEEARLKRIRDIERVRERRKQREEELEEMERLRNEEQRLREAALYGDWQDKEEEFHVNQTLVRSKIRLVEGRERPIDLLAKNILLIQSASATGKDRDEITESLTGLDVELREPLTILDDLTRVDIEDLITDIGAYIDSEKRKKDSDESYLTFWEALKECAVVEFHKRSASSSIPRVHKAVERDVEKLLAGKSAEGLEMLAGDIRESIRSGKRADVEYWEAMVKAIEEERSRVVVKEFHAELLRKQLAILSSMRDKKRRDGDGEEEERSGWRSLSSSSSTAGLPGPGGEDAASLALLREEQQKGLEDMEERMQVTDEVSLPEKTYWWHDKYRPRKPRYFNRVKTGYDWNKYNQTHYDHDNPPPKLVQGYKFNVFYPDLIDKTKTPKFIVEASDDPDYAILRFTAGPPYEDIAFKVVNREWGTGRKSGFRCVFERGVLYLHFNFKRHFYRR